jgi:hypothetical protein
MMATVATVLGVIRWLLFVAGIASSVSGLFGLKDFVGRWQAHQGYQQAVQSAVKKGDTFAAQSIEPVAAPDITSWLSWAGPGLMALASFVVSQWVSNPALKEWLQKLLVMVSSQGPPSPTPSPVVVPAPSEDATDSTYSDKLGDIRKVLAKLKKADPVAAASVFQNIEALCANVPPGGEIFFEMTTASGIRVSVSGKVVAP